MPPPISPIFDSNNGYGNQLDVNKAINAKFKEPVQKEYDNLGLTLTDNETEYIGSAYAIAYNSTAVSIEIDAIEYSLGIPTDLDDLVLKLNDVLDIGIFYLDAYDDIIARGFHDFGDILQDGHAIFEPDIVTPLTNKATQSDINRELALRVEAAAGGGGTVTSITYSLSGTSLQSIFDVNSAETATITTSGTFTMTLNTQTANYVFAGPTTGAAAIPTFRALVLADIPTLSSLYWAYDGNTVGSEKFIGTIDAYDFPIRTTNIERMVVAAGGNVGIGVAVPTARLHVVGSGTSSATVNFFTANSDSSKSFAHYDSGFLSRNGSLYSIDSGTSTSWGASAGATANGTNTQSVFIGYFAGGACTNNGVVIISGDTNNVTSANYGTGTVAIGNGAVIAATGTWNVAYGVSAGKRTTTGGSNVYLGTYADMSDSSSTASNITGNYNIVIGSLNQGASAGTSFVGGNALSSNFVVHGIGTTSNQIVFGGGISDTYFTDFYIGKGVTNASPTAITIHATSGSGSNVAGANLQYAIGQATGNAASGDHIWYYAPSGSSGTTLTTLTEAMRLKGTTGQLIIGNSSNAVTSSMLQLTNVGASPSFYVSSATPESAITGTRGDICLVNTGAAGQLYVKATGSATNTGWLQLTTGSSGAYLLASGATTGATSQKQVFTSGIETGVIDDNGAGEILMQIGAVDKVTIHTNGILVTSGAVVTPSYSFIADSGTGFYLKTATSELGASVNGALVGGFNTTGLFVGLAGTLTGTLQLSGSTSGTVTINTAAAAGTWTLTLPTTDGNSGEFLQTNGSGVTTWAVPAGTGANTALSNLASVAINTTLLPGSNDGAALGSGTLSFSDLFLASGGLINFANSDWIATHSTGILTVGTGDLRITTAGTNSASVVTVGGAQTLTGKSIVATQLTGTAYTFAANNTNATAAYTLHHYENHDFADYGGTFTWNSTPPSTIVTQKYAWSRIGNTVTLFISVLYTSAGTTNTTCSMTMPTDCPNPSVFANSGDAASEYMYPINGARVEGTQTANPSAIRGGIRRNSGDTAFEINLIFGSTSALQLQVTVSYRTA